MNQINAMRQALEALENLYNNLPYTNIANGGIRAQTAIDALRQAIEQAGKQGDVIDDMTEALKQSQNHLQYAKDCKYFAVFDSRGIDETLDYIKAALAKGEIK